MRGATTRAYFFKGVFEFAAEVVFLGEEGVVAEHHTAQPNLKIPVLVFVLCTREGEEEEEEKKRQE
jgi:hypothetical protein